MLGLLLLALLVVVGTVGRLVVAVLIKSVYS